MIPDDSAHLIYFAFYDVKTSQIVKVVIISSCVPKCGVEIEIGFPSVLKW